MTEKIGVALIGTGNVALLHVLGYRNFPHAEIRAICDKNLTRSKNFKKEAMLPTSTKVYKNSEECVRDENVDLIEVLTPHSQYEKNVIEAAEAGKHVSVQKAPTLTLSSYDRMVTALKKAGRKFRVYENYRYHPPYIRALELIQNKEIGTIGAVNMRNYLSGNAPGDYRGNKLRSPFYSFNWRYKEEENYKASNLFDDGYHRSSIIQAFMGDMRENFIPITAVRAYVGWQKIGGTFEMDVPAVVIYETQNPEVYGTWNASYSQDLPFHTNYFGVDEFLEIAGSKGIMFVNGCVGNLFVGCECGGPGKPGVYWFSRNGSEITAPFPEAGTWKSDCTMKTDFSQSFIDCTRHFASLLARDNWFEDNDPRPIGPETGRNLLRINIAVIRSIRNNGSRILINDIKDGP